MTKKINIVGQAKIILDLVAAGLEGNASRAELVSLNLARLVKEDDPDLAKKINEAIGIYSLRGSAGMRSMGAMPLPVDSDTQLEMASIIKPNTDVHLAPVLNSAIGDRVKTFLEEREKISVLLEKNIKPSNSLLLIGPPGTGKTMLAKHIASSLNKDLVVMDLSASISSLLGKTGHNLKKVLQYAKQSGSVLLLDEFDAIAKRRDDNTDLGEIKRVVNVLLMELEDWPVSSVLIATSNHPELLDKAIWRRFDHIVEMPLPEVEQRYCLLRSQVAELFEKEKDVEKILHPISQLLENKSSADICKFANNIKRRIILRDENAIEACFMELSTLITDKKLKGDFIVLAKKLFGKNITVRELSRITGLSSTGVQHYITKRK